MGKAGFAEDYLLVLSCWTLFLLEYKQAALLSLLLLFQGKFGMKKEKLRGYRMENMQRKT